MSAFNRTSAFSLRPLVAAAALLACAGAFATEGGGSSYPGGNENFLAGAAPPPGVYAMVYGSAYTADTVRDNAGDALNIPGFKITANAILPRFVWSTPFGLPKGNLLFHTVLPLVDLKVRTPGGTGHDSGLGDVTVGGGWAMHHSPRLHSVLAVDLVFPTGSYDRTAIANLGRNHGVTQPVYAISFIDPAGFNADAKLMLNLNRRNKATGYKSGNEFFADYSAGWAVAPGWVVGVGGYLTRQISDDDQNGVSIQDRRTRAIAFGPSMKYDNGNGWFITAKFQKEYRVLNRAEGQAFWIKTNIPF